MGELRNAECGPNIEAKQACLILCYHLCPSILEREHPHNLEREREICEGEREREGVCV